MTTAPDPASNGGLNLSGKLLIAMPGMADPRFEKSVIFLCAHSPSGAMGLIVNKPRPDIIFSELLAQLNIETPDPEAEEAPRVGVHFGGPVEGGRGFVLHTSDYSGNPATLKVGASFGMTATIDILKAIAHGQGPSAAIFALGYAGWGPGQLERELADNGWLTCEAEPEIVFDAPPADKWRRALKTLGVEALTLSATAGRA